MKTAQKNQKLINELRNALMNDSALYGAFIASIASALKDMPAETWINFEKMAEKIADRIIGKEEDGDD